MGVLRQIWYNEQTAQDHYWNRVFRNRPFELYARNNPVLCDRSFCYSQGEEKGRGVKAKRMKKNMKIIGAEAIYMFASAVVAGIAALIQMIGRTYEGDYSGFIFSGSNYRYNLFFYIIGLVLFIGFMIAGYRFFLQKRIRSLGQAGTGLKILFFAVALLFAIVMLAVLVFCSFLVAGLNDNIRPKILFQITGFGWPLFCLIFLITAGVRNCRRS